MAGVPGIRWDKIEVWAGSANEDVFDDAASYAQFRIVFLRGLSDLGILDHLINDCNFTLDVLNGVGGPTGVVIALISAAIFLRRQRNALGGVNDPQDALADRSDMTVKQMRVKALEFLERLLYDGPIQDRLALMVDDAVDRGAFNALIFIRSLDTTFFPKNEVDKENAHDAYNAWVYDLSVSFNVNVSRLESLVQKMKKAGVSAEFIPDTRQLYIRLKTRMMRVVPEMLQHFDYVQTATRPCYGPGRIAATKWMECCSILAERLDIVMRAKGVERPSTVHGQTFMASGVRPPSGMSRRTMAPPAPAPAPSAPLKVTFETQRNTTDKNERYRTQHRRGPDPRPPLRLRRSILPLLVAPLLPTVTPDRAARDRTRSRLIYYLYLFAALSGGTVKNGWFVTGD